MNILILGSGGREHALAWAVSRSPKCSYLICAPGNPGMESCAECVSLDIMDSAAIVSLCQRKNIELVIVGPEGPLVAGIVDDLTEAGIAAFGPTAAAACLEGSKSFTKDLCRDNAIPTAAYRCFSCMHEALHYIQEREFPIVIKADGLAAGKGVTIAHDIRTAESAVSKLFEQEKNAEIVIEDYLEGEEVSLFFLTDGKTTIPLGSAQDHKRAFDGDKGPNTGGMGAYSPAPVLDEVTTKSVIDKIINPTLQAMSRKGTPFRGILYAGLMLTQKGPQLIEYNVRFGDPECQTLLVRLKDDIVDLLQATLEERLSDRSIAWSDEVSLTVVMASSGYPGDYEKGTKIRGLETAKKSQGVTIFHAGTIIQDGQLVANGGRVLNITACGKTVQEAQQRAYAAIQLIDWPGGFYRKDIGWRAINRVRSDSSNV